MAAGETKNILKNATDDAEVFEITNRGTVDLKFGRGANSSDMGLGIPVGAGVVVRKTALELGASGNKFLNVQNGGPDVGAYKVVRE